MVVTGAAVSGGRPGTLLSAMAVPLPLPPPPPRPLLSEPGADMEMPAVDSPSSEAPLREPIELSEPPASSAPFFLPPLHQPKRHNKTQVDARVGQCAAVVSACGCVRVVRAVRCGVVVQRCSDTLPLFPFLPFGPPSVSPLVILAGRTGDRRQRTPHTAKGEAEPKPRGGVVQRYHCAHDTASLYVSVCVCL